jgi:hypothetical protein
MSSETDYARILANKVLSDLGDGAPDWEVESARYEDSESENIVFGLTHEPQVLITIRSVSGKYESVAAYFTEDGSSLAHSTAAVADAIQDHAVEEIPGGLFPPCPGHGHPAVADVVAGVPTWVCMTQRERYYSREILPGFEARFTKVDQYLELSRHQRPWPPAS